MAHKWNSDISLGIGTICANFVRFRGSQPSLPQLCPVSVWGGGGMGYIWKALEKGYLDTLGLHVVLMIWVRFSCVLEGAGVACCLFLSTGSYHVRIQINPTCCCFP